MFNILFNPKKAERHPLEVIILAFIYSSLSIFLSVIIFPEYSSILMIFLTVLSCVYILQGALKIEEKKEFNYKSEKWVLKQHYPLIKLFIFLFMGFVLSFFFWTVVIPNNNLEKMFSAQISVVKGIQSISMTGNSISPNPFFLIFFNNLKVLLISLVFALFYGAGSIFILVWNASIMGFVIGSIVKKSIGPFSIPLSFGRYFLHGFPEMLAYFIASLAGGILFIAFFKGDIFKEGRTRRILVDFIILIGISIFLVLGAALIEVYISPFIK